jgi:hypothetical protein
VRLAGAGTGVGGWHPTWLKTPGFVAENRAGLEPVGRLIKKPPPFMFALSTTGFWCCPQEQAQMLAAEFEPGLVANAGRASLEAVGSLIKKLPPLDWISEHVSVCRAVWSV